MFVHGFVVSRYFSHSNFYIISLRRKMSALLILSTKKQRQSICNFNGFIYLLLIICFIAMFTCLYVEFRLRFIYVGEGP